MRTSGEIGAGGLKRSWMTLIVMIGALASAPCILLADETGNQKTLRLWIADTATETGINDWLVTDFESRNPGIRVETHVAGALEVLDQARQGKADIVVTHVPSSEKLFVDQGFGTRRAMFMYNDFVILGPKNSPNLSALSDIRLVMKRLAQNEVPFQAPSPRSGTNAKLSDLWAMAGIKPNWVGYESTGESAISTLRNAALFGAYTFVDMGTYLAHRREVGNELVPVYRDNMALRNIYSVIVVSKNRFPDTNEELADEFFEYLVSDRGQSRVAKFDKFGANLFMPAAGFDDSLRAERTEEVLRSKAHIIDLMMGIMAILLASVAIVTRFWVRTRRLEALHRISEERFYLAVAGSNDGIWDWDIVEDRAYISQRLKEIIGIQTSANIVPDPAAAWVERIHPGDREDFTNKLRRYLETRNNDLFSAEFRVQRTDGEYRPVMMRGKAMRDSAGKAIRLSGAITDITSLKEHEELEHQALHDALTGLPNRLLLFDRMHKMIMDANVEGTSATVIMIDLDRFKEINDTHGHVVGDHVLQYVAKRLHQTLRKTDMVGRYGGDEFIVLLPTANKEIAVTVSKKILAVLSEQVQTDGRKLSVGASLGIAIYPDHGEDGETLIRNADAAMFAAKRMKGGIAIYDGSSVTTAVSEAVGRAESTTPAVKEAKLSQAPFNIPE